MPRSLYPWASSNMLRFRAWKPASVTNWNLYPIAASSVWNRAIVVSSSFFFQLNDGEQLYASSFPGYSACTASAKRRASSRFGSEVSPQHVRIRRVSYAARNGRIEPPANPEEAFAGTLAGEERVIARVNVAGQKVCAVRVGARENERRHAHHVRSQARCDQLLNRVR